MAFVYLALILALVFLPLLLGVLRTELAAYRRRRRAGRAWGLGLRRSGPWFWRVGGQ